MQHVESIKQLNKSSLNADKWHEATITKYNIPEFFYQSLGLNESAINQTIHFITLYYIKKINIEYIL
jgi:hypothetical protein